VYICSNRFDPETCQPDGPCNDPVNRPDPNDRCCPQKFFNCIRWNIAAQGPPPCGKTAFQTLNNCVAASREVIDGNPYCGNQGANCVNGQCVSVPCELAEYTSIAQCESEKRCGRYKCLKTSRTCERCEFIPNTSDGYTTLEDCDINNPSSLCGKQTYNCDSSTRCPDGRILSGECTPICSGGEFPDQASCDSAGCHDSSYGPRYKCVSNTCTYISPCIDPNPQDYWTNTCNNECGGIVCRNGECVREDGNPGTYGSDSQCANNCECKVYLDRTGGYAGCSKCKVACGSARRKENGGPCTGCDALGRNCTSCNDTFTSMQNCELYRISNDIVPHTCYAGTCLETDSLDDPSNPKYCGNYCSRSSCLNTCAAPKGWNCVRKAQLEEGSCEPVYCGTGQFSTYKLCKDNCKSVGACGYNCKSRIINGKPINDCIPACVQTDEGTGPVDLGEFQTYELCKSLCTTDYGWTCKGNNCVRAGADSGPGTYASLNECLTRCVIPNQTPCGDAYSRKIINRR